MTKPYVVYGQKGTGSVPVEATLLLLGEPYEVVERRPSDKPVILERTAERMAYCWRMMDAQVSPGRYVLGEDLSVLDLYVTVVSCWARAGRGSIRRRRSWRRWSGVSTRNRGLRSSGRSGFTEGRGPVVGRIDCYYGFPVGCARAVRMG